MGTVRERSCMVLFQGRTVTPTVQLPEADTSSSLALSLNTKARALPRDTRRHRHAEEGTAGMPGMTMCPNDCVLDTVYLFLQTQRPLWKGHLCLSHLCSILTQTRYLQNMLIEGVREQGPCPSGFYQVPRASQTDSFFYMILKTRFLFIFSKSAVSCISCPYSHTVWSAICLSRNPD